MFWEPLVKGFEYVFNLARTLFELGFTYVKANLLLVSTASIVGLIVLFIVSQWWTNKDY